MKGSIVIKKTHLLNMISNEGSIFRSRISKDSKMFSWGRKTAFQNLFKLEYSQTDWNELMNTWGRDWASHGFGFLFGEIE